jgi:hypothetical protein
LDKLVEKTLPALRHLVVAGCGFLLVLCPVDGHAQESKGENYSADKTPAQLFSSDCTGSSCHSGPRRLAKGKSSGELSDFLRDHYTNSRQSAAALETYLLSSSGREIRGQRGRSDPKPPASTR